MRATFAIAFLLVGCEPSVDVHCKNIDPSTHQIIQCIEYVGVSRSQADAIENDCIANKGVLDLTVGEERCDHSGSLGGCKLVGSTQTTWFWPYGPLQTTPDLQAQCSAYVAP